MHMTILMFYLMYTDYNKKSQKAIYKAEKSLETDRSFDTQIVLDTAVRVYTNTMIVL